MNKIKTLAERRLNMEPIPCRVCGNTPTLLDLGSKYLSKSFKFICHSTDGCWHDLNCGCGDWQASKDKATEDWNRRMTTPVPFAHSSTDEIICPHCSSVFHGNLEHEQDLMCFGCWHIFHVKPIFKYTTTRISDDGKNTKLEDTQMNNQKQIMQKFVQERNEALLSLDENKIKAYLQKYQVGLPSNPISFWGAVYKAILAITDAPEDKKAIARAWLKEHGMRETF